MSCIDAGHLQVSHHEQSGDTNEVLMKADESTDDRQSSISPNDAILGLYSSCPNVLLSNVKMLSDLLWERNLEAYGCVNLKVVFKLANLLEENLGAHFQYEVVRLFVEISEATEEQREMVVSVKAHEKFIEFLSDDHLDDAVAQAAVDALMNIAKGGQQYCFILIDSGIIPALNGLARRLILSENCAKRDILLEEIFKSVASCYGLLFGANDVLAHQPLDTIRECLWILNNFLAHTSDSVVSFASWSLYETVCQQNKELLGCALSLSAINRLVDLTATSDNRDHIEPALLVLRDVVRLFPAVVTHSNVLPALGHLLRDENLRNDAKLAVMVLACIGFDDKDLTQEVSKAELLPHLAEFLRSKNGKLQRRAASAIRQFAKVANTHQIVEQLQYEILPTLVSTLANCARNRVKMDLLGALQHILRAAEELQQREAIWDFLQTLDFESCASRLTRDADTVIQFTMIDVLQLALFGSGEQDHVVMRRGHRMRIPRRIAMKKKPAGKVDSRKI